MVKGIQPNTFGGVSVAYKWQWPEVRWSHCAKTSPHRESAKRKQALYPAHPTTPPPHTPPAAMTLCACVLLLLGGWADHQSGGQISGMACIPKRSPCQGVRRKVLLPHGKVSCRPHLRGAPHTVPSSATTDCPHTASPSHTLRGMSAQHVTIPPFLPFLPPNLCHDQGC